MALVTKLSGSPQPAAAGLIAQKQVQSKSRDRLNEFLQQGIEETPERLMGQYGEIFDAGNFGFGGANALGGDQAATSAINARMRDLLSRNVGFQRANLLRSAMGDYQSRQGQVQGLHDALNRRRLMEAQIAAQKKAAKKAKRAGLGTALAGVAGAAAGGYLGAGTAMGGPTAALIGSGLGQSAYNF